MDYSLLLTPFSEPLLVLYAAAGTFLGIYVGAIPGLSATMAISLLVSLTYGWDVYASVALMTGVYVGAVYGGSRSAILLNIPGAPAAVVTGLDGYPLARKGLAGKAMAAAAVQSVLGTLFGAAVLLFAAPAMGRLALRFRSVDYLILGCVGLVTAGSLGGGSIGKSLFSAALGLFLGTVGMDSLSAVKRFTFGVTYLNSGVNFVVALIGLFGVSEALCLLGELSAPTVKQNTHRLFSRFGTLKHLPLSLMSAAIGAFTGALPGAGGDIAALLAYDAAKRAVKKPSAPFGEGAIEGVIAPETANNAAIGGAFIPMLTLGIPGDSVTAIYISALMLAGLEPGPGFLSSSPDIFMLIVALLAVSAVFMLVFSLSGIRLFSRLVEIPRRFLIPLILVLSAVGAYALNYSVIDIIWVYAFGVIGWALKRHSYPVGPAVLGIVLEKLLEENLRRGLLLNGNLWRLFLSVFSSPVSAVLLALLVFMVASGAIKAVRRRK